MSNKFTICPSTVGTGAYAYYPTDPTVGNSERKFGDVLTYMGLERAEKLIGKRAVEYGDREPPFQLVSQGLGYAYASANKGFYEQKGFSRYHDTVAVMVSLQRSGRPVYWFTR